MRAAGVTRRGALALGLLLPLRARAASGDLAAGLTAALVEGARRVVAQLGRPGGFLDDPGVRIPLPPALDAVRPALQLVGLGGLADDLDLKLNRAAEQAAPVAVDLLVQAIQGLTFEDALGILNGPRDSATRYLERQTAEPLAGRMRPVIEDALRDVGALAAWDGLVSRYRDLPFLPDLRADLVGHVVAHAEQAIFARLGTEEARIRTDPAARTTAILRQVFGR